MPTTEFDYDSIPVGYYDAIFHRRKGAQSKWHHLKFARVRRELQAGWNHLDVACGPGTFIGTLPDTISSVGVDVSRPQIDYARARYAAPHRVFEYMEPGKLAFPDACFDGVTCIELIEHISAAEARQLMREILRVLRPGGRLVVTTPNYGSLWPMLEYFLNRTGKVTYEDQHITHYTRPVLHRTLLGEGFEQVRVQTCLLAAPFLASLSWKVADLASSCEEPVIAPRFGHLLVATAHKPCPLPN